MKQNSINVITQQAGSNSGLYRKWTVECYERSFITGSISSASAFCCIPAKVISAVFMRDLLPLHGVIFTEKFLHWHKSTVTNSVRKTTELALTDRTSVARRSLVAVELLMCWSEQDIALECRWFHCHSQRSFFLIHVDRMIFTARRRRNIHGVI